MYEWPSCLTIDSTNMRLSSARGRHSVVSRSVVEMAHLRKKRDFNDVDLWKAGTNSMSETTLKPESVICWSVGWRKTAA